MSSPVKHALAAPRRLLIIDDDAAVLASLGDYFDKLGYTVIKAATGRAGVTAHLTHNPDVTILDLRLPDVDGIQVLELLRQRNATVVMLTGYGDIATAVQAMRLGAENFLTKPVELEHLVAAIERAGEKADLRRENVKLRRLVPSRGKRARQLAAAIGLVALAWFTGRALGGDARRFPEPAAIAPTRQLPPTAEQGRVDSLLRVPAPTPVPDSTTPRKS